MVALRVRAVAVGEHLTETSHISVSIILPTLNEAGHLNETLKNLFNNIDQSQCEVIISDGGSQDSSLEIAARFPCRITSSTAGRANQMNQGSRLANGQWLLFLHADSELPNNWLTEIESSASWGFFPIKLSGKHGFLRIVEHAMCLRSSLTSIATGDQGLFFDKSFFEQLAGFPEIQIMEDVAISKKARRFSIPKIAGMPIKTSSRRWEKNGIGKTILLMWWMRLAYWFGTNPERLHRLYYPDLSR